MVIFHSYVKLPEGNQVAGVAIIPSSFFLSNSLSVDMGQVGQVVEYINFFSMAKSTLIYIWLWINTY
jgi:hypothetical protein